MIAEHLEPKGLHPTARPINSWSGDQERRASAVRGSMMLRNAILLAKGIKPPVERRTPLRVHTQSLCPSCRAPVHRGALIAEIQQAVAAYYGLPTAKLISEDRRRDVAWPRQVAMFLVNELTHHSVASIGRRFSRDHTTVLHALRAVRAKCDRDENAAFEVAALRERLAA